VSSDDRGVRGYNRLACWYRPLEFCLFGSQLQRARVGLIDRLPSVESARILGGGDGRFLEAFCQRQPDARVESVDFSPAMLRRQRQRVARSVPRADVDYRCVDARHIEAEAEPVDLLVCNFFLDCFTPAELETLLPRMLAGLKPSGWFYYSDFAIPRSGWWRYKSALDQFVMHCFFRWQTGLRNRCLPDLDSLLASHPLALRESANCLVPLVTGRLYQHLPDGKIASNANFEGSLPDRKPSPEPLPTNALRG